MPALKRGIAVPNFGEDPAGLIDLGEAAERGGFDGYFLWDHLVHSGGAQGPPIVDPWQVLAVVAARTSRIKLGTMITRSPGGGRGSWPRRSPRWTCSAAGGSSSAWAS